MKISSRNGNITRDQKLIPSFDENDAATIVKM